MLLWLFNGPLYCADNQAGAAVCLLTGAGLCRDVVGGLSPCCCVCCLAQHGICPCKKHESRARKNVLTTSKRFRRIRTEPEHIPIREDKRDNGTPLNHDPIHETKT